jgi:glycosyltransferase involved in cell wall biosynthesis
MFTFKGGDLVLEAFRQIRAARPHSRLVMIGNDEARRKAAGMDGVEVHGFVSREQLNGLYHGASVLLEPMLADPWGQVYLEAMAAKALVVGLDRGALPELTKGGALGVLVSREDPQALAGAVLTLLNRPQAELRAMADAAQASVLSQHTWQKVGERAAAVMRQAVAGAAGPVKLSAAHSDRAS